MQAKQDILNTTQIYLNLLNPEGGLSEGEIGNSVFNKVQSFKKKNFIRLQKDAKNFSFIGWRRAKYKQLKKEALQQYARRSRVRTMISSSALFFFSYVT